MQLLWKGKDTFNVIFDAVRDAKLLICLEFYIFRNDETGVKLAELLKQKSREGVRVCLLYDHFGSLGTPARFWEDMRAAGVSIYTSRPFKWSHPCDYIRRDHKKLIIIDLEKAFTGGLNIADEYSGFHIRLRGRSWRDTGVMLKGPIVASLLEIFKKSWYFSGGDIIETPIASTEESLENIPIIPIFAASSRQRRSMRRLIYHSLMNAQKSISLTTAYFAPSKRLLETLKEAVLRGVNVRLLVPGKSDVPAVSYAGRAFFSTLLDAGVEVYTYSGDVLHAKTYIFDEYWSIVGSTNLDFQSLRYNDEGNVGILNVDFGREMTTLFDEDIKRSVKINRLDWGRRPLKEKALECFFSLFRRRL
ncbi:MAG: phospholipase D-like domain-containing protein [Nitrospirae bacterium]|nr:phospholipase D-like domain-containing protein [Nitrospirota bacterium]